MGHGWNRPHVQQYSFGIQHDFKGTVVEARYVGNHVVGAYRAFDFNQAPRAARIIPATRKVTPPIVAKRSIIYPAYSIGAAVVLLLIMFAGFRTRRARYARASAMLGDAES